MNPIEEARVRRIDAILHEALRRDLPTDLEARILSRLGRAPAPARRSSRWTSAAAFLLGCGIVFAISQQHRTDDSSTTQDPVSVIGNVDVQNGIDPIVTAAAGEAGARLLELARANQASVVIPAGVLGESKTDLSGMSLQTAVRTIARDARASVLEFDGVLAIGSPLFAPRPAGREQVTMRSGTVDVRAFFKQLHAHSGISFIVGDDVRGRIAVDVDKVGWRDLLDIVAKRLDFRIVGHGQVIAITKRDHPDRKRTRFSFTDAAIANVATACSMVQGLNTVVDSKVTGEVSLHAYDVRAVPVLRACAACVRARVDVGKIVHIEHHPVTLATTTITAESYKLAEQLPVWNDLIFDVEVECPAETSASAFVTNTPLRQFVRAVSAATGRRLSYDGDTYTIR